MAVRLARKGQVLPVTRTLVSLRICDVCCLFMFTTPFALLSAQVAATGEWRLSERLGGGNARRRSSGSSTVGSVSAGFVLVRGPRFVVSGGSGR